MARKPQAEEDSPNAVGDWIVTFSDCMTLLLCFFVLLLTFSSFEEIELGQFAGHFKGTSHTSVFPVKRETLKPVALVVALSFLGVVLGGCGGSESTVRTVDFTIEVDPGAGTLSIKPQVDSSGWTSEIGGVRLWSENVVYSSPNLTGDVKVENNTGGQITSVAVNLINPSPDVVDESNTDDPWVYGTIFSGGESSLVAWSIRLESATSFTFTARLTYSP